jgi:hypothetical protein
MSRRTLPATLALLLAQAVVLGGPTPARGAEYTMQTVASYEVRPSEGRIGVAVDVSFTNTTPDPPGQFSVFETVKLAIHDQATSVAVTDDAGDLAVTVAREGEVNVASVTLREPVRFEASASFRLAYDLPDGEDPRLRVRPSVIVFPAWGFGTASEVTVVVPNGYEVSVDGDTLSPQPDATQTVLSSGAIADPTRWLALVTGSRATSYTTLTASVPLDGGTVDLRVRAFADDRAWGERTLALLERALALLEERFGLPYPRRDPLVVTEAVAGDATAFAEDGATDPETGEILVAFDQPPFTTLHQVGHLWLGPSIVADRWIGEGLASSMAAAIAPEVGLERPYDPSATATELPAGAFPMAAWPAAPTPEQERFGYAASWALFDEIAATAGPDVMARVLQRVAAAVDPSEPVIGAAPTPTGRPVVPLTTRGLLDHLETVSGLDFAGRFAALVLTPDDVALLPQRGEARLAHAALVEAAAGWEAPEPVRMALAAWEFDTALDRIAAASTWLEDRDALLATMEEVGLAAPDRLRDSYRQHGGGPEAQVELDAERAVTAAYVATLDASNSGRTLLARVGLLGAPDPAAQLTVANGRFAAGDLRGASEAITEAQRLLDDAESTGILRLLSVIAVLVLLLGLVVVLLRRRRVEAPSD